MGRFEAAGDHLLDVLRERAAALGVDGDDQDFLSMLERELEERGDVRRLLAVQALRERIVHVNNSDEPGRYDRNEDLDPDRASR